MGGSWIQKQYQDFFSNDEERKAPLDIMKEVQKFKLPLFIGQYGGHVAKA
jgi:hypothetical protein